MLKIPIEGLSLKTVTATLKEIFFTDYGCVIGNVFGDTKKRFNDDDRIKSSEILEIYIVTRNSVYKVDDKSWIRK